MEKAHTVDPGLGPRDAICTRRGAEAMEVCRSRKTPVEVTCPDCSKFELPRVEFGHAESQIVDPDERE